jgi:hypothetical protein
VIADSVQENKASTRFFEKKRGKKLLRLGATGK